MRRNEQRESVNQKHRFPLPCAYVPERCVPCLDPKGMQEKGTLRAAAEWAASTTRLSKWLTEDTTQRANRDACHANEERLPPQHGSK